MDAREIATRLPPRREDEPASLRQDIVDEILDHLQCGLRRELLVQGGDEATAKERVLSRFGDPREVARKLWFQAMWSQIMSQRIVVGSALLSMVVCAALIGMMVWIMQQQQQANAAMLEHIVKLIPQPVQQSESLPVRGPRRVHLQVKANFDSIDGPPAVGSFISVVKLQELGQTVGENSSTLTFTFDQAGFADCGLTQPGRFEITARSSSHESTRVVFTIPNEEDHIEQIILPSKQPEMVPITFSLNELPDDLPACLKENSLGLVMRVRPVGARVIAGRSWRSSGRWPNVAMPLVLLSDTQEYRIMSESEGTTAMFPGSDQWLVPMLSVIANWKTESTDEWSLPEGEYTLQFGLANLGDSSDPRWAFVDNNGRHMQSAWLRVANNVRFVASSGHANQWSIKFPDYVLLCLRDPSRIQEAIDPNTMQGGMGGGGMMGGGGGGGFF